MTETHYKSHPPTKGTQEKGLLIALVIAALFFVAFHVSPLWNWSFLIWFKGLMILLAIVGVINASLLLGYRKALIFLVIAAVIGYSMEQIGIWTGAIFGPYTYTPLLGAKIIDVPWVIPLCWFAVVYFAHVITNLIVHANPVAKESTLGKTAIMAVLTAFVATGLDLSLDPAMSSAPVEAWIWTDGGEYMGVPFKNFQGWVITAFLMDFIFRMVTKRFKSRPISDRYRFVALFAILAWAGLGIGYMLIGNPVSTQLVSVFAIVLPAMLAAANLYMRAWNVRAAAD